ncbi:hypothetical protein G5714_011412 [Onychostoma macrolepis]|uniref:Transcription factor HES-5 n=1 Tax=Onychostoma macrolepis TaxID=369639 RepID=A0A7J6CIB7_9TELE|nr:hypothetical protein G5714_011412 [Onychostoma macrolepis]
MTPTIISKEHLPLNNKLRKPRVEKMRRDRINSSIEQLKCLLAPEFFKQQPESKLEKADILEMTLNFMQHHSSSSHAVNQSFSRGKVFNEFQFGRDIGPAKCSDDSIFYEDFMSSVPDGNIY